MYVTESIPLGNVVYAPMHYFKRSVKKDSYSYNIVRSKTSDLSGFFWPYIKKMVEELNFTLRFTTFDLVSIMPSSSPNKFSPTLESIAKKFSEEHSVRFEKILERTRQIKKMTECGDAEERIENVRGSFGFNGDVSGKRILIIDDVLASGSNAEESARVLKSHGATQIEFYCFGINSNVV